MLLYGYLTQLTKMLIFYKYILKMLLVPVAMPTLLVTKERISAHFLIFHILVHVSTLRKLF